MSSPKTVFGIVGLGALLAMLAPVFSSAQALTPAITNVAGTSTTDGTGANITWTTDIPSNSQVEYGTTTSYGTFSALLDTNSPVTSHAVTLSALAPNTLYHFAVLSMASSSSATSSSSFAAASADHTFVTASGTSTSTSTATSTSSSSTSSPPVIGGIMSTPAATTATITWTTDQPATSQVAFGTSTNYSASTTPDTSFMTNHSVSLSGLTPSLLYHFQVIAGNGSTTATSSDQTFMTLASTTGTTTPPTASTTPITISNIASNPGTTTATVTWNTDQPSSSRVEFGTTTGNYFASTTPDNSSVTSHSVGLFGLTPNLLYHFRVLSSNASTTATSSDQTFMTLASTTGTTTPPTGTTTPPTGTTTPPTSTSTPPTTSGGLTMDDLFNLIQQLQARVSTLESQVHSLLSGGGTGSGTTTPPTTPGNAFVDQNGQTFKLGGSVDFGGHNFGSEEHVSVMLNGQQIATGFTNTGGGFSTGSLSLPSSPGTYTYTFVGQVSGKTTQATITVQ